jgi:hypothetical protein
MAADAATYGPREGLLAPLPAAERGVAVVLGASPDGKYLVYGSGTSVVVRSIDDPALCVVYSEHTAAVKVAKFAPTGKYIASGGEWAALPLWGGVAGVMRVCGWCPAGDLVAAGLGVHQRSRAPRGVCEGRRTPDCVACGGRGCRCCLPGADASIAASTFARRLPATHLANTRVTRRRERQGARVGVDAPRAPAQVRGAQHWRRGERTGAAT